MTQPTKREQLAAMLNADLRNRRKYSASWEYPDRKVKEWDVVDELLMSMHAEGDRRYAKKVEPVDDDWPDCVIQDSRGLEVGVEVTELVDQEAVEMCEKEKEKKVYRAWSDQEVREKIEQILAGKDRKAHHGNLYSKLILVIHTDEFELTSPRLFPILDAAVFPRPRNIDEAYLICSYEPRLGYPYRRLNLDGATTG